MFLLADHGGFDDIITWAKDNPLILIIGVVVFMFWDKIAAFFPSPTPKPVTPVDPPGPPAPVPPSPPTPVVPVTPIIDKLDNLIALFIKFWPIIQPLIPKGSTPEDQVALNQRVARIEVAIDDLKNSV